MTTIPPEATAAAYRGYCEARKGKPMSDTEHEATSSRIEIAWQEAALTAALPHIEAAIREQVAQEIEAESRSVNWHKTFINGLGLAARIVRGGSDE